MQAKKLIPKYLFMLFLLAHAGFVNGQKAIENRQWSYGGSVGGAFSGLNNTNTQTYFNFSIRPELNYWNHNNGIYGIRLGVSHSESYYSQYYTGGMNTYEASLFYRKLRNIMQSPFGIGFDHEIGMRYYHYDGFSNDGKFIFYHFTPVVYFQFSKAIQIEIQMGQFYVNRFDRLYRGNHTMSYGLDIPGGSMFTLGIKVVPQALRQLGK